MTTTLRTTGLLLIGVPLVFTAGFTGLQLTFEYPDILRHPAGEVLTRFAGAGADLHFYWYAMMAAALAMIPAAIGLGLHLWERDRHLAAMSIGAGVLAGLVQALGLLRWVILVPGLAASYVAPGATEAQQQVEVALFDAANRYLGMGVGEHLGYLFTAAWTLLVAALIIRQHRYIAVAGGIIALGVVAGMGEPFGVPQAGTINAISYTLWAVWTLVLGVVVLRGERRVLAVPQAA
jgi:phage shock protein PspC (stress-responsive transcriptional regulator)